MASQTFTKDAITNQTVKAFESGNNTKSKLPILVASENVPLLSAQGVIVIDLDSAVILYEKNPDKTLYPASTTKIMTALVAYELYDVNEVVTVKLPPVAGQKMGLVNGEKITVASLIDGLLIYSGNDAAEALAALHPHGREGFINAMNQKATELHLLNTTFKNPSGLDDFGHSSTARDLVRLSEVALRNPQFAQIVATKEKSVQSEDGAFVHKLTNINELLGQVDGVLGVKTGWTENARENLVTYIDRDEKRVLIAVLGSQDRFGETKELINWVYENHQWVDVNYSP